MSSTSQTVFRFVSPWMTTTTTSTSPTATTPRSLIVPLIHYYPHQTRLDYGKLTRVKIIHQGNGILLLKADTSFFDIMKHLAKQVNVRFGEMPIQDRPIDIFLILPPHSAPGGTDENKKSSEPCRSRRDVLIATEQDWVAARPILLDGKAELEMWFTQEVGGFEAIVEKIKANMLSGPSEPPPRKGTRMQDIKRAWRDGKAAGRNLCLCQRLRKTAKNVSGNAAVEVLEGKQPMLSEKQMYLMRY